MQHKITVLCDRCHKATDGIYDPDTGTTGGYYRVSGDIKKNAWAKYRKAGETNICDKCMHSDRKYIAVYGPQSS